MRVKVTVRNSKRNAIMTELCSCTERCERSGPNFFCPYVPEGVEGHGIDCKIAAARVQTKKVMPTQMWDGPGTSPMQPPSPDIDWVAIREGLQADFSCAHACEGDGTEQQTDTE